MKNKDNNAEIKYANWNDGYVDLFREIKEIRSMGNTLLFDIDNKELLLNTYYSRVNGLFLTHQHYVVNRDFIAKKLELIGTSIFKKEYLKKCKNGTLNYDKYVKTKTDLMGFFQQMCESFSRNGLTMKVIVTKPKASDAKGLTDEEQRELQALEEVGIM